MEPQQLSSWLPLELERVLAWRRSLDGLRNLAVGMLTAMIIATFALPASGHLVIFFGSLALFAVMIFEARAFQHADAAEARLADLERHAVAPALDPTLTPDPELAARLAESLGRVAPRMRFLEAIAGRIHDNYAAIFLALDATWVSKIYLDPAPATSFSQFVHRADLGLVPGWFVLSFLIPFWGTFVVLSVWFARRARR